MKKQLNYQTIELYGVKLTLGYTVSGQRYIPATRETPEEQPEATIHKIYAYDSNVDLTPLLENYIETIYELLNDKI
jgi:hypothetical protein